MIVCAAPRSGATKYCLDLQESTGLEFIGELNPMYMTSYGQENKKLPYHETLFQPSITKEQYIDYIVNKDKYILLCNQASHLLIDQSGIVILRKSLEDTLLSLANFLIKCRPYLGAEGIIQHLHVTNQSIYGMLCYLSVYTKPIIWYEDHYNITGTNTDLIKNHKHGRFILKEISNLATSNDAAYMIRDIYHG